jgi:7,8-dihydropterin-6-yl-methyl-4-(beta-D-ribofuranosyl)aminobenzene 5'-phosphate synthase
MEFPVLDEDELASNNADIKKIKEPYAIADSLLATGEIERVTDFEKGFPIQYAEINNELKPDPLIMDDQALIVNVDGKGIVIITGCGHAGIINTINYAKKVTGIDNVYAVLGGFHLSGKLFEKIIEPTIHELLKIKPAYVVPCHCTGYKSIHKIANVMPDAFIQNSVGTKFVFQ